MNNWAVEVLPLIRQDDYQNVCCFYEEAIENNPEDSDNYLYLGLLYLLQQKEEEAQAVWLSIVFAEDESMTDKLINILEIEANYQELLEKPFLAWLIRKYIKEFAPENINNIIQIFILDLKFNISPSEELDHNLSDWGIIDRLKNPLDSNINSHLLLKFVELYLLYFPNEKSILLADTVLTNCLNINSFIQTIDKIANHVAYNKFLFFYAIKLNEICLKYLPDDWNLRKNRCWYLFYSGQFELAIQEVKKFDLYSKSLHFKTYELFSQFLVIYFLLHDGRWLDLAQENITYHDVLEEIIISHEEIKETTIRESLIGTIQPLLYFEDRPAENRRKINAIARIFQKENQKIYSCPISFDRHRKLKAEKKIKIGYIGQRFRNHPIGILTRWLLKYHDRDKFEITLYFVSQKKEDEITDKWFNNPEDNIHRFHEDINAIVTQIEKDEIDILIDLESMTSHLTSLVLALKPAPIQVSWLGLDASGIPAIDYFIADPYVLPEEAQEYYPQKIWRLPSTYIAVDGFELGVREWRREDLNIPEHAVVYLSLQTSLKRHPDNIRLQMKILSQVPNSYFLIPGGNNDSPQKNLKQLFTKIAIEEGYNPENIKFLPYSSPENYRANLGIGDVVLDTFPFNGATTTLDALWLEIPLVTKVGKQFHARQGYTFLKNLGINEGLAWNDEEYIAWGINFGTDKQLRREVSWKLRQSKKTSFLWKSKQFTKEMEKAYQQMWEIYLQGEE